MSDELNLTELFSTDIPTDEVESQNDISPKARIVRERVTAIKKLNKEKAAEVLTRLPLAGETLHIVSNGLFDYWDLIPIMIDKIGGTVDECILSTWTIGRRNTEELLQLMDGSKIKSCTVVTGKYFKRREPTLYAALLTGLRQRGGVLKCLENHTKIALLRNAAHSMVMEGSANLTANPRLEQNQISDSPELYDFHAGWIREFIAR